VRLAIFAFLFLLSIGAGACNLMSHPQCDDKTVNEVAAPDDKHAVVLAHRSCLNGTSYTLVRVQEITRVFAESKNILILDGIQQVTANWKDSNQLEISSDALGDPKKVLTQDTSWQTVIISYKQ